MSDLIDDEDEGGRRKRVLSNGQVLGFVARFWKRRPVLFGLGVALTLLAVAFDLALPYASGHLVDAVVEKPRGDPSAWSALWMFVGVYFAFAVVRNISHRFWIPLAARNMEEMTNEGFARVQAFSSDWHADSFAGATVRKLTRAMWGYDSVTDAVTIWLGPGIIVLVGLSFMMLFRQPLAGVVSLVVVAAYLGANLIVTERYVRPSNLRSNALDSKIGGALADAVTSNPTVKSFGAEARETARIAAVTAQWREAVMVTWNRFTDVWLGQNLLLVLLQAGLTGSMVWGWSQGTASPGDVAFAITAFMLMSGYLRNLGENIRMLQKGLDDAEDVAAWERLAPQIADAPGAPDFRVGPGAIAFEDVSFRYRAAGAPLYDGFSLTIAPGERVALVGPTGSGKSTFVKLIQRLHDLQGGRVVIDGQDVAAVTQGSLRRAIAVVPQDPALFHRTLSENIAYGKPDATREEIEEAARRAHAHDFILKLPHGYDTLVGERGVKLSGGERQRVAIARAFLTDAPILVLDEATSSLDVETEADVQLAAEALMAGRTTIVIAHRLSTVRGADRILVFQKGRVVEEGRHAELKARGGVYARLNAVSEGVG
ncbi:MULTISPECIES: ABC transporter ATP-binding protein [unclassified Caulobacter]|uniref:ABC transporter ATP-binding protein n=1 Tax=unclassified Caulobacter TaxID=2648921 RepID=UPI000D356ACD|nr:MULTISPECIES: ABC transporter ATP-binding protein [unclassified Caulobacter]PTS91460.1 multidrug ABC transporter ATP-binding protein [Caulobacter sp. HMWF009]PTT12240.1 multidrug ABC transporter ATP-binding protein [Caulobacter sp. HMWF025]